MQSIRRQCGATREEHYHHEHTTWVIAQDDTTPNGDPYIAYWSRGGFSMGGAVTRPLGAPDELTGTICTFLTKAAALAAYREAFGSLPRGYRAMKLSAEDAALARGESIPGAADTEPTEEPTCAGSVQPVTGAELAVVEGERHHGPLKFERPLRR